MAKRKNKTTSPAATRSPIRTRSNKKHTMNEKKTNRVKDCYVRLKRLTEKEIMTAVASNLTTIDDNRVSTSKYNLRNRNRKPKSAPKPIIKRTLSTAIARIQPSDMTVTRLWKFLKKEFSITPYKNLCCLAKMNTYSPWPSMVLDYKDDRTVVYFFGEGTTGTVQSKEIVPFEKCPVLARKYLNVAGYSRAVRELEISLNIPLHASITK